MFELIILFGKNSYTIGKTQLSQCQFVVNLRIYNSATFQVYYYCHVKQMEYLNKFSSISGINFYMI